MRLKPMSLFAMSSTLSLAITLTACGVAEESTLQQNLAKNQAVPVCGVTPACDASPAVGTKTGFLTANPKGKAFHFGKDFYYNESEDQWIIAKFQYGNFFLRSPLVHEEVTIQLLRDCGAVWETLGTTMTTSEGEHADVLHYADQGGMVFFKIPTAQKLGLGRHRIRLVVSGDQSATELFLEVLPQGATLFVSDVDGTLTTSELVEGLASILGTLPPAHPGAAVLFNSLTKKGYRPLYLTARSTNLVQRTRDFVKSKKFPQGVIQTSPAGTLGLSGAKGAAYKTEILQSYENRGFNIAYGFGNTAVDAEAFSNAAILDTNKYFFKFDKFADFGGGVNFDDYTKLGAVAGAADLCI